MNSTIETVVEGQVSELVGDGAKILAPGAGVYVSTWTLDSNQLSHNLVFDHGLQAIPLSITVLFSPDKETAYPLLWSWNPDYSGNPVSVSMNDNTITLAIFSGAPLHGFWSPTTGWTTYTSGYFMVIASTTP